MVGVIVRIFIFFRLVFNNLKQNQYLNTVNTKDKDKIWIPQVVFYNTEKKEESSIDSKAYVTIDKRGKLRTSLPERLHNDHIFEGRGNYKKDKIFCSKFLLFRIWKSPHNIQSLQQKFHLQIRHGPLPLWSAKLSIANGDERKFRKLCFSHHQWAEISWSHWFDSVLCQVMGYEHKAGHTRSWNCSGFVKWGIYSLSQTKLYHGFFVFRAKNIEWNFDNLFANNFDLCGIFLNQLLQGLFLWSHCDCQSYQPPGLDHSLHQCFKQFTKNSIRQDDWHLANILPLCTIYWGHTAYNNRLFKVSLSCPANYITCNALI